MDRGAVVVVIVWWLDLQLPMQSVTISSKIVSSNPAHVLDTTLCDEVCQWLTVSQCFSPGTPVSSNNKMDCHNITEILLKVALNTITPGLYIGDELEYHYNPVVNSGDSDGLTFLDYIYCLL